TRVRVEYVGKASLSGSDDTRLEATLRRGTPAPGPGEIKLAASQAFMAQSELGQGQGHGEGATRIARNTPPQESAKLQQVAAVERAPLAPVAALSRQA